MWKQRLYIIILFFTVPILTSKGQYYLFNNEPPRLELSFSRHSLEAENGKTIFNVLKVVNKSQQSQTFTLNLTVPSGWSIIGSQSQELTIPPLDSMLIPVRVAIGEKVRGDIGYSIIAALNDLKGNSIRNEYSFVKVPRETDLRVKFLTRLDYFDQQTGHSSFSIKIENRGNREEMVYFQIEADNSVGIEAARLKNYSTDINIPPFSDTIIHFNVFREKEEFIAKELSGVKINARTIDSTFHATIWFRDLKSIYINNIPETRKALIAEFYARGLFANYTKPTYASLLQGNILLNKRREIFYYYSNDNSEKSTDFYKYNRMWIGFKNKTYLFQVGDINTSLESAMQGRGGLIMANYKSLNLELIGTKGVLTPSENYGVQTTISLNQKLNFILGGAYNKTNRNNLDSKIEIFGVRFNFEKKHYFILQGSFNQIKFGLTPTSLYQKNPMGLSLNYNSNIGSLSTSIRFKYGDRYYNSSYNGRSELFINSVLRLKRNSLLQLYLSDNRTHSGEYSLPVDSAQSFSNFTKSVLSYGHNITPRLYASIGPGIEYNSSDIFPTYRKGNNSYFSTFVTNLNFGFRVRGESAGTSLSSQLILGRVDVKHYETILRYDTLENFAPRSDFYYQFLSFNLRLRKCGLQTMFTNGPKSMYEQFSWFYGSRNTRILRFMPYFDAFIYKDIVKLQSNLSYSNDIVAKSSYTNLTTQVFWYLPREWTLRFLNVYTVQSRVTPNETTEKYQNLYFEVNIRKEFDIQQPRQHFYTLNLAFFKDYNGDRVMGDNEPGIKNVLINIQRIDEGASDYPDFVSGELLSDQNGRVTYEKIPAGVYQLIYNPIGNEAGTFSKSETEFTVNLGKNETFYIPFVEKNKVFGKIILNRSRLSGLGKVDVSNVRIIATDSKGRTYSALTNKNGEFVIYAPITDQYVVNVNNIFYENFDLRQNNFRVQFNGYKQFEVNFVYDEKLRRINFGSEGQGNELAGVMQVRRTNLLGTVKDALSLKALRARVNIINTKTNSVVTSIYSNSQSGDFNLSFLADENYLLEILAEGYWYYSENLNLNQVTTFLNVTKDVVLKPISIGSKIELNIKFEINKTDLEASSVAELNRLLKLLKENENIKIEVQGHSDDLEALSNPQISEERAKKVARYLIENGFSNIQIRGFGNTVPVASNDTEQGRSLNRRVEIEVISK